MFFFCKVSGLCYLCKSETLNESSMERVNRLPRRERPVDYYDYIDRLLEKSKKFVREHEGLGFRLD